MAIDTSKLSEYTTKLTNLIDYIMDNWTQWLAWPLKWIQSVPDPVLTVVKISAIIWSVIFITSQNPLVLISICFDFIII